MSEGSSSPVMVRASSSDIMIWMHVSKKSVHKLVRLHRLSLIELSSGRVPQDFNSIFTKVAWVKELGCYLCIMVQEMCNQFLKLPWEVDLIIIIASKKGLENITQNHYYLLDNNQGPILDRWIIHKSVDIHTFICIIEAATGSPYQRLSELSEGRIPLKTRLTIEEIDKEVV